MPTRLNPYLQFDGSARDAMTFYQGVLGGELSTTTFAEGGVPHDPADAAKLMHSQLESPAGVLMASDAPAGTPATPISGVSMSLFGDDESELARWFEGLAEGGTVVEPLVEAPWGDRFGMLLDRFGVGWMVNISGPHPEG